MPPGTPYASFALPYPIRIDCFTCTAHLPAPYNTPALYLLTHSHTDHILGLSSKSFAAQVVCSPDTKEMLLRHEIRLERAKKDAGEVATRTFAHLKVQGGACSRDLLHAVPLNTPTEFELSPTETVTITLVDANHCPGAAMFLIEGPRGTILHTGDVRAEHWLLKSLTRNPFLQPYIPDTEEDLRVLIARDGRAASLTKTLNAIYLDTACMLRGTVVPTKENAVKGLVELIALFDKDTYFFINSWTWGYEDVLKGIARAFQCQIHVDRYKHAVYTHISDPFLRTLVTRDATSTRFHACERFERCNFVDVPSFDFKNDLAPRSIEGKKVVYVNPVTGMGCAQWEGYRMDVRRRLAMGKDVDRLLVPLERHSPLPELLNLVSLFRPRRVVPNTLVPALGGLDWTAMNAMFKECMAPPIYDRGDHIPHELNSSEIAHPGVLDLASLDLADTDPAMKNLVGDSAELEARKWADDGSMRRRLEVLRWWLGPKEKGIVDRALGRLPNSRSEHGGSSPLSSRNNSAPETPKRTTKTHMQVKRYLHDSDDSSDDDGSDAHVRTARLLFAGDYSMEESIKSWLSSSPSRISGSEAQIIGAKNLGPVQELSISAATAEADVQDPALEGSVEVPVSIQTNDTALVPAITLSADQSLPTPVSSPDLRPRDVKGKGKEIERQRNADITDGSLPPFSPHTLRSSSPTPFPRPSDPFIQISRHMPTTLPAPDKLGEGKLLTRAQSVMSISAFTSPFESLEDVVMAEAELSLPELLDDNSLKPPEVHNVSIRMCEDASPEYDQQSIETPRKDIFSQTSSDAPLSQRSQALKSLSNQELSSHPSLPLSQIQSQRSHGHRRKRRRLEEPTSSVPETEHSDVDQVIPSLISAFGRRKTEESIDGPHAARPHYRSFRVPSPDLFLDTTSELMPPSHKHKKRPSTILPRNLAPSLSAPSLGYPQLEISAYRRRNEPLASSSTSVLVTVASPRTITSASTIPLLLGDTSTISLASSSKVPRPSFVISEKSSNSRSAERRKRREIAEKLCLARPDLVDPSYAVKRSRRFSRLKERSISVMQDMSSSAIGISSSPSHSISAETNGPSPTMVRREFRPASRLSSFSSSRQVARAVVRNRPAKRWRELLDEDTGDVRQTMDWERSRRLAQDVTGALAAGRKASDVLPPLVCISARKRHLAG